MLRLVRPSITAIVIGSVLMAALLAAAVVPLAKAYWSIPLSNRASAYKLGILPALRSDDLHAIWEGRAPDILFRARERDDNNKYVWQEAALVRIGNCLDMISAKTNEPAERPVECSKRDKLVPSANRLHFRVAPDRAITVGVSGGPPKNGSIIARGALFGSMARSVSASTTISQRSSSSSSTPHRSILATFDPNAILPRHRRNLLRLMRGATTRAWCGCTR